MPKIFPIIKKVVQVAGGAVAWRQAQSPGLLLTRVLDWRSTVVNPALLLTDLLPAVKMDQKPALGIVTRVDGGVVRPTTLPALLLASRMDKREPQTPALEMQQAVFTLNHEKGGVTATPTGTWTNAANAQGDRNGTNASCVGEVGATVKRLALDYSNFVDKSQLTITAVELIFYSRLQGALLADTSVQFERSLDNGSNWATLATVSADYDELVAGRVLSLSPVPTWAQLDALQSRVSISFPAAGATKTFTLDAIHVLVRANLTWSL